LETTGVDASAAEANQGTVKKVAASPTLTNKTATRLVAPPQEPDARDAIRISFLAEVPRPPNVSTLFLVTMQRQGTAHMRRDLFEA
jgi:hypothetical protein